MLGILGRAWADHPALGFKFLQEGWRAGLSSFLQRGGLLPGGAA